VAKHLKSPAQSSLEFLLLISGAIVLAVIVITLLSSIAPSVGQQTSSNLILALCLNKGCTGFVTYNNAPYSCDIFCEEGTCSDRIRNNGEAGVDCGNIDCPACLEQPNGCVGDNQNGVCDPLESPVSCPGDCQGILGDFCGNNGACISGYVCGSDNFCHPLCFTQIGQCENGAQCVSYLSCASGDCDPDTRTCVNPVQNAVVGGDCSVKDCSLGLICNASVSPPTCQIPCEVDADCSVGNQCRPDGAGGMTCQTP